MQYQPKNILVTGGAGFIGSHVVIHLIKTYPEYNIFCFDKLDYCSNFKNLLPIIGEEKFKFIKGDIISEDLVTYVIQSNKIDTVLHFAAQSHVDHSFGNSIEFTKNNVLGTHVLLEASKVCNVKRFIHVSTDEVYGEKTSEIGAMEGSILEPTNPYAATKAGAEHLVKSYYRSFKLPVIISRGNNVYGPHQYPEKIIPKFICLLSKGRPCCIHGDGSHRRSYLFIDDVVLAFDIILHKGIIGEIYNVASPFEISNLELARKIIQLFHLENANQFIEYCEDRLFNDRRYFIDGRKLYDLGWKPVVNFDEGLKKTIEWYRKHPSYWEEEDLALIPHPIFPLQKYQITSPSPNQ